MSSLVTKIEILDASFNVNEPSGKISCEISTDIFIGPINIRLIFGMMFVKDDQNNNYQYDEGASRQMADEAGQPYEVLPENPQNLFKSTHFDYLWGTKSRFSRVSFPVEHLAGLYAMKNAIISGLNDGRPVNSVLKKATEIAENA